MFQTNNQVYICYYHFDLIVLFLPCRVRSFPHSSKPWDTHAHTARKKSCLMTVSLHFFAQLSKHLFITSWGLPRWGQPPWLVNGPCCSKQVFGQCKSYDLTYTVGCCFTVNGPYPVRKDTCLAKSKWRRFFLVKSPFLLVQSWGIQTWTRLQGRCIVQALQGAQQHIHRNLQRIWKLVTPKTINQ